MNPYLRIPRVIRAFPEVFFRTLPRLEKASVNFARYELVKLSSTFLVLAHW